MSISDPDFRAAAGSNANDATLSSARERVIALLTDRFADDSITVDEFEARLDQLHSAKSASELETLVRGLSVAPMPHGSRLAESQTARSDAPYSPAAGQGGEQPSASLTAILGETTRTGLWLVPHRLDLRVILGEVLIDLRYAVLPPGGCEIALVGVLGRIRILVPPGVVIDDGVTPVISTVLNEAEQGGEVVGGPQVRLTGTAVMSEVVVRVGPPGERAKLAWKEARPVRGRR